MRQLTGTLVGRRAPLTALILLYASLILATGVISLTDLNYFEGRFEFIWFGNYLRLLDDQSFLTTFNLTVWYSINSTLLTFAFASAWLKVPGSLALHPLFVIAALTPWFIPPTTAGVMFQLLLDNQQGLVPALISTVTRSTKPDFLGNATGAFWATIVADAWQWAGIFAVATVLIIRTVPIGELEVVAVFGGSRLARVLAIWLPHLARPVGALLIFKLFWSIADFDKLSAMTNGGGPLGSMRVFGLWVERSYFEFGDFGYGAAASVVALVLIGVAVAILSLLISPRAPT